MSVLLRGTPTTYVNNAAGTDIVLVPDAAVVAGDDLYAIIAHDADAVITPPIGWDTYQDNGGPGMGHRHSIFRLHLTGSPASSYTFVSAGSNGRLGVLIAINPNGCTFVGYSTPTSAATSAASIVTGSVTVPSTPNLLLASFTCDSNDTIATPPSGMTRAAYADGSSLELDAYYAIDHASGATTKTLDWSTGGFGHIANIVAIEYAAGGGGGGFVPEEDYQLWLPVQAAA